MGDRGKRMWLAGVAAACLLLFSVWTFNRAMLTAVATASAIVYAGSVGRLGSTLAHPVFQFFGRISYSLYLIHVPVGLVVLGLRARYWPTAEWAGAGFWVVAMVSSVLASWLFHRVVESPSIALSKRFR